MKKWLFLLLCLLLTGCAGKPEPPVYDRVTVAVLDTGISTVAIDPQWVLAGQNYADPKNDTQDRLNHGTAVAGILAGCESAGIQANADPCYLIPLVVVDRDCDPVSPETLAQAVRDAVDRYGADIINLSLGIQEDTAALAEAVAYAEAQGVLVVAAVGNSGDSDIIYYPAACETVLAVGSHDRNGIVSRFSQKNGTADLLAPGEDVWFAARDGGILGDRGTSYATGYVSAAAVHLLTARPDLTPAELRQILTATARDIGEPGWDSETGWGILDLEAALEYVAAEQ